MLWLLFCSLSYTIPFVLGTSRSGRPFLCFALLGLVVEESS